MARLVSGEHERLDPMALRQRDLEHRVIRALVEAPPTSGELALVGELRELYQQRADSRGARGAETVLIDFAVKAITEALAAIIADFDFLLHPAEGYVSWYNDTDSYVHVLTFDQDDAVRWVPYEDRVVAPKQVVLLTARGDRVHVKTLANNATYDCEKKQVYLFNGMNCYPRVG